MIRILHIFHEMNNGGIEHFVMEYYRHIDRSQIQFDFLTSVDHEGYFDKEILELGGRLFRAFPLKKNPVRNFNEITRIVRENNYNIVHRHTGSAFGYFDLHAAKLGGAKHLILHSHNNQAGNMPLHYFCKAIFRMNCEKLACSKDAGKWLYGKNASFLVINNAIECQRFQFQDTVRDQMRKQLKISDKFVIGHVGRFEEQKNHHRLLEIIQEIVKACSNVVLVCVGTGSLEEECVQYAQSLGISDNIRFLGMRNDIPDLMCAFDTFLLPSLYEGFPFVLIEAQASGLNSVVSTRVPSECNIMNNIRFLSLSESNSVWAKAIIDTKTLPHQRCHCSEQMRQKGYDLTTNAIMLADYYKQIDIQGE